MIKVDPIFSGADSQMQMGEDSVGVPNDKLSE